MITKNDCIIEERIVHSDRGFTLPELLISIAIIAMLAAILLPVFAKARQTARTITCISNMSNVGKAFMSYLDQNDGRYPSAAPWGAASYWAKHNQKTIQELLAPYVGVSEDWYKNEIFSTKTVFVCPNDFGLESYYGLGDVPERPVWRYTGSSYEYYASNQENWLRSDMTFGTGVKKEWTALSPKVVTANGKIRIGAPQSMIISPSQKAVIGDLGCWHLGDKTPDGRFAYRNTLFSDGHAERTRGLVHFNARYNQSLRPWHASAEVDE